MPVPIRRLAHYLPVILVTAGLAAPAYADDAPPSRGPAGAPQTALETRLAELEQLARSLADHADAEARRVDDAERRASTAEQRANDSTQRAAAAEQRAAAESKALAHALSFSAAPGKGMTLSVGELAGRYDQMFTQGKTDPAFVAQVASTGKEVEGDLNVYINGHALKLQPDYQYLFGDPSHAGKHAARLQLDASF